MIEAWVIWVVGTCMFAAGMGVGHWLGQGSDWARLKAMLDHTVTKQTLSNAQLALENEAYVQSNVAQKMKDERTAAYYASRRGQEPSSREQKRARNLAEQAVNGHDDH